MEIRRGPCSPGSASLKLDRRHAHEKINTEAERLLSALGLPAENAPVAPAPVVLGTNGDVFGASGESPFAPSETALGIPAVLPSNLALWGSVFSFVFLVLIAGMILAPRFLGPVAPIEEALRVASVSASIDAMWSGRTIPDAQGWLPNGTVHLRSGQAEIQFTSGAKVVLKAPAEFEAVSSTEARLQSGSLTARVDGSKTTFRIQTPTAQVVDLGTEFGLSVAGSGETDVAVFDGMVDVASDPMPTDPQLPKPMDLLNTPRRLTAGEALRVDWQGQFRRITTITDETFPLLTGNLQTKSYLEPPLVSQVTDTLRAADENPKFYRIVRGGFGEDAQAYVDRRYQWNGVDPSGIPSFLEGADYIMPFNDDKIRDLQISIQITRPATIYVLLDDRGASPQWIKDSFVDTGFDVGMDEDEEPSRKTPKQHKLGKGPGKSVDYVFSVWKRDVHKAGTVVLGPLGSVRPPKGKRSMYGIVLVPLDEPVPAVVYKAGINDV